MGIRKTAQNYIVAGKEETQAGTQKRRKRTGKKRAPIQEFMNPGGGLGWGDELYIVECCAKKERNVCGVRVTSSDNDASLALIWPVLGEERSTCGVLEHFADAFASLGATFEVMPRADLLRYGHTLFGADGPLTRFPELFNGLAISPEILLASHQDNRESSTEMHHFRNPLLLDVVEGIRAIDGETDKNDMRVGIGKRSKAVIVFLAGRIPKSEFNMLAIDFDVGDVVLKDGWYIHLWECTLREDDQQTCLSTCTITDNNEFTTNLRHDE